MVNITDTFTRLYGRPPTGSEIATMMSMKAEQDARKNSMIKRKKNDQEKPPVREPKQPTKINNVAYDRYKWPKRATIRSKQVNRMMKDNLTIEKIAHYLGVKEIQIMLDIERFKLPQEKEE